MQKYFGKKLSLLALGIMFAVFLMVPVSAAPADNPKDGATGLTGVVPAEPPTQGATISFPTGGQVFTDVPIEVTGVCPVGLLVKLFKNEVFAGSATCDNGTFTITTDLFSGSNDLVARVYDELDQPGPDSNTVTVVYDDSNGETITDRVVVTTNYAKRGANPGATLTWPMTITGGTGPYAVSIDWGDGEQSLFSLEDAGDFDAEHIYATAGTYKIIVKVTDANGTTSFLQLVGVANGAIVTNTNARVDEDGNVIPGIAAAGLNGSSGLKFITWPLYIMLFLILSTFWLGRRYEIKKLKRKLASQQSLLS